MTDNDSVVSDDEMDEYPEITQADFGRAMFRIGRIPVKRGPEAGNRLDAADRIESGTQNQEGLE